MIEYLSSLHQFFLGKEFIVPLWEFIVYAVITSSCLLLGKHRIGLIIAYGGVFYWGFILNYYNFLDMLNSTAYGFQLYVLFGCSMLIIAVVGFFTGPKDG